MVSPGFTSIGVPNSMIEAIKKIMSDVKLWRTPTEFIIDAAREKVEIYQKAILDQKKVDMYFSRRDQIKAESKPSNVSLTHNRSPS